MGGFDGAEAEFADSAAQSCARVSRVLRWKAPLALAVPANVYPGVLPRAAGRAFGP